jgi:hypothetical protein
VAERSGDLTVWQLGCVVGAMTTVTAAAIIYVADMRPRPPPLSPILAAKFSPAPRRITVIEKSSAMSPNVIVTAAFDSMVRQAFASADVTGALPQGRMLAYADNEFAAPSSESGQISLQPKRSASPATTLGAVAAAKRELPYVKYYVYSEVPPAEKPADIVLEALSDVPLGTPLEEIKRAADAFGLDENFMKTIAKIESDFDPHQRTGSYIGLFQLSNYEFARYGSGEITNPRDNAVAAADKFINEAALFEDATHKKPTFSDLYLIHQQGWQGAAEHVSHPDWVAWKSMCATDEGSDKGEQWCKRAIWANTLPAVKHEWKSVDRLTSAAFVAMWRDRVDSLYARYSEPAVAQTEQQKTTEAAQP